MSWYTDVIEKDPRFQSPSKILDLALLEPTTRSAVMGIIKGALQKYKIALAVTETYRSTERQEQLFDQGLTELKTVGVHHYGLAADFCKMLPDGSATWKGSWDFMADLCQENGMIWGGNWGKPIVEPGSFVDLDHVQRIAVADQDRLFEGLWYPPSDYQPGGTYDGEMPTL